MDVNLHALEMLVRERLAEARREAAMRHLLGPAPSPGVILRHQIGAALIRLGEWLRDDERARRAPASARPI